MKKVLFILIIIIFVSKTFAQKSERPPYPNSIIDVGIGGGTNHGMLGVQTVLGYKGSGLMLAGGFIAGSVCYQIGLQGSYKWAFASVAYGTYNFAEDGFTGTTSTIEGIIILAGGKINLVKSKKLYLQLAAGYAGGGYIRNSFGLNYAVNGPTFDLGLGYRIPYKNGKNSEKPSEK